MDTWADIVARIVIAASLIVCAIPSLFFLIVSEAESRLVIGTLARYIDQRCTLVRPWIPTDTSPDSMMVYTMGDTAKDMQIHAHNQKLRMVAFQSTILVLCLLMSTGVAIWFFFGTVTMTLIMARIIFYIAIFCIMELIFINTITRLPLIDTRSMDIVVLNHLIEVGQACSTPPGPPPSLGTGLQ